MPGGLQWPLVATWGAIGSLTGIALGDPFSRGILLLVPAGLAAAWLLWSLGVSRETGAALVGLGLLPALAAVRAENPPCPVGGGFVACQPGLVWPWVIAALVLVVAGLAIIATAPVPNRRTSRAMTS